MSKKPTPMTEDSTTDASLEERRRSGPRGQAAANPLKRLKGALSRPVTLEWRKGQPHVALVERRKNPRLDRSDAHLCSELCACLLMHGTDETKLLDCLVTVHDVLSGKGWQGVGALPAAVLAKAIQQAEMLAAEEPLPALAQLATQLGGLHTSAVAREEASKAERSLDGKSRVEVSETSFNEFEEAERNWTRTMPSDLAPLYKGG